jgi:hypothetical protein
MSFGDVGYCISENLVGSTGSSPGSGSLIDTAYIGDGWLTPPLYQQWTNHALPPKDGTVSSPDGQLDGESYSGLHLYQGSPKINGIGLYFLSQHLVTLDFPNRMLYLKRTSVGSLHQQELKALGESVAKFLKSLKEGGQLPGWSPEDHGVQGTARYNGSSALAGTLTCQKKDDPSVYHFQVVRASENSPWLLKRAWRTDRAGRQVEEYPLKEGP